MDESPALPPDLAARLAHVPPGALDFEPAPVKARHDGWTPGTQKLFVLALAAGLGISGAVRAVGKARQTAYRLRHRPDADSFAAAWDRALGYAALRPCEPGSTAWERAVEGVPVPIHYRGQIVGERRKFCHRTLAQMVGNLRRPRQSDR